MPQHWIKALLALPALLAALALTACGSGDETTASAERTNGTTPDTAAADPDDVAVITGWVDTLAIGDVEGAARYFALPSIAENGPLVVRIRSLEDAVAFNESLPCGAELISAETAGDFTAATFRLIERPGGDCGRGHRRHRGHLVRDRGRQDRRVAPGRGRGLARGRRERHLSRGPGRHGGRPLNRQRLATCPRSLRRCDPR